LILDTLDNNSDIILTDIDGNSNETAATKYKSTFYEDREMSKEWIIAEIDKAKAKNRDISLEDWKEGLLKRYQIMKEVTERHFPHAWDGVEFTLSVLRILNIDKCTIILRRIHRMDFQMKRLSQ
jgi:hypothetical protein